MDFLIPFFAFPQKAEEPEIKLPISAGSYKKQERSRKMSTFALLTTPKTLTVWITVFFSNLPENETHLAKEALIFLQLTKLSP